MIRNSEIQKYYWQSFSRQRILAMPLVIVAIAFLVLMIDKENPARTMGYFAYQGFYIVVFLWGGYQAACALVQEVKENTWDNPRLSCVSPLELTIGKLFGSTMYTWYGGVLLLMLYCFSQAQLESTHTIVYNTALVIGAGVLCHSVALLSSLLPIRMHAGREHFQVAGYFILGLIISGAFLTYGGSLSTPYYFAHNEMQWFHAALSLHSFFLGSLCIFLCWTIWAIYRFMRSSLQFKNTPIVWGLFVAFCMLYFAGLIPQQPRTWDADDTFNIDQFLKLSTLSVAFFIGIFFTYVGFFCESMNIIRYRTLIYHWQGKTWKKVAHIIPMWAVSLCLSIMVGICSVVLSAGIVHNIQPVFCLIVSVILFVIRDAGIFHYFTLVPNGRLPLLAAMFYLGLFYLLIPNLLFAMGIEAGQIGHIFYPTTSGDLFMVLPVVVQITVLIWLLKRRYYKVNKFIEQE